MPPGQNAVGAQPSGSKHYTTPCQSKINAVVAGGFFSLGQSAIREVILTHLKMLIIRPDSYRPARLSYAELARGVGWPEGQAVAEKSHDLRLTCGLFLIQNRQGFLTHSSA